MTLAHLLVRQARQRPESPAILRGSTLHATHGEWAARSAGLAQRLREAGLVEGDRVLLFAHNHPRYLEALWGIWWAGMVAVPVNAKLHPREVEWIVANSGALGLRDGRCSARPLAGLERPGRPRFTRGRRPARPHPTRWPCRWPGGSWATWPGCSCTRHHRRPKAVMLTHRNLMTMGLGYFVDVDPVGAGRRHRLRRADLAWRRHLRHPAPDGGCAPRGAGLGRRRSGRAVRARAAR